MIAKDVHRCIALRHAQHGGNGPRQRPPKWYVSPTDIGYDAIEQDDTTVDVVLRFHERANWQTVG